MPTDQRRLEETLDAVVEDGVLGAMLVTRDGFCMMNRCRAVPAPETLSAMTATMLGAAEAALGEMGGGEGPPRVHLETPTRRVLVLAVTPELLLVGVSDPTVPAETLRARLDKAAEIVARIVPG